MRSAAFPLLLLAALPGQSERAIPSFSSGIEVVRLDVSVTRDGEPVKGLTAASFKVFDDGVPQSVELVGQYDTAIHAVLALDTSLSVSGQKLADLKRAAHLFVDALKPEDALSLLTFSECTDLASVSSQDRNEAHTAIELAQTRQTTSLRDASLAALIVADPEKGRPLLLLVSDGQDVGSWTPAHRVVDLARQSEVVIHAVIPLADGPRGFAAELTNETGGRIWNTTAEDLLGDVFVRALEEFRSRYRLQYEPKGVKPGGWHRVKVRLRNATGDVRARPGYLRRQLD